jgi:hypothetical protein
MDYETQMRIEHKLDMVIRALQHSGLMISSPLPNLRDSDQDQEGCPVCGHRYSWATDIPSETVRRRCGCDIKNRPVPGISKLLDGQPEDQVAAITKLLKEQQQEASDGSEERTAGDRAGHSGPGTQG